MSGMKDDGVLREEVEGHVSGEFGKFPGGEELEWRNISQECDDAVGDDRIGERARRHGRTSRQMNSRW